MKKMSVYKFIKMKNKSFLSFVCICTYDLHCACSMTSHACTPAIPEHVLREELGRKFTESTEAGDRHVSDQSCL